MLLLTVDFSDRGDAGRRLLFFGRACKPAPRCVGGQVMVGDRCKCKPGFVWDGKVCKRSR